MKNTKLSTLFIVITLILCANNLLYPQNKKAYNQAEYIWNLSEIYASDELWEADYNKVSSTIKKTSFDHLDRINSPNELSKELETISTLRKQTSKVAYYGILRWEEGQAKNGQLLLEKSENLLANFEALITPVEGLISKIDRSKLRSWLENNSGVNKHRHWLNLIIDQSAYRASPEAESVLRKTRHWISSSVDTFWAIHSSDSLWKKYQDEDGNEILLNRSAYRRLRNSNDYNYRDIGAKLYFESLNAVSEVMGQIYLNKIKAELDLAKLRGFEDGINSNWAIHSGSPRGSYKVLLNAARKNKQVLQRYVDLRRKVLQKGQLHYLDFFKKPEAIQNYTYDFNKSMLISLESAKFVGDDFYYNLKSVLKNKHWMHLADIPKTANYHIRPPSGDIHPFFILKYKPRIVQARALAGGLFDLTSSYPSIGADGTDVLEAPVHISGVLYSGGILYDKILASKEKNKEKKIAHLIESLEYLKRFFKNAILMELDSKIQSLVIQEQEVTGATISSLYLEILRGYYGHSKGIINLEDYLKNNWMTETAVLFMPKYEHHFWAPSIAVAAKMVLEYDDKNVRQLFFNMYAKNKYDAYSTLKSGSIDLMNETTYNSIFKYMNNIMDEIEMLLE